LSGSVVEKYKSTPFPVVASVPYCADSVAIASANTAQKEPRMYVLTPRYMKFNWNANELVATCVGDRG
jgi:hypothetical protein